MMKINIAFIVMSLIFSGCTEKKVIERQERAVPVKVMDAAASAQAASRSYVGTVEEAAAVALSFASVGTVEQVLAKEGQRVRKGQLLATLNAATAQNAYDAAKAKLVQAEDAYTRLAKVHAEGSLADIKFAEIEAGLQQAKSMVAISRKSLDDCKLYAPRDGVIAARSIEPGANAMPGVTAFRLVSVERVKVKISVPESEIGSLTEGQEATVVVPALDNAAFKGKIEMKGVTANPLSHTYEVKIAVDESVEASVIASATRASVIASAAKQSQPQNPVIASAAKQSQLLPGMVCKVETRRATSPQSEIVVPNSAIRIAADNRHYVWLAENNVARRRYIAIGDLADNGIIVSEGLSAGDKIIIEGFRKICEGTSVSINN